MSGSSRCFRKVTRNSFASGWCASALARGPVWHTHTVDQILYIIEGKGVVGNNEGQQVVSAGTLVFIPKGDRHFHGATDDCNFAHVTIAAPHKTNIVD